METASVAGAAAGAAATGAAAAALLALAAPAAALTAAPSRTFMRLDTSCRPPKEISPSPTTSAGE